MILAEKIMSLRKRNGWSQEELAEQLDVSRQSVSKWESGASIPDIEKIIKMSQLFSVSTDYLLKDSEEEEDISKEQTVFQTTDNNDSDSQGRKISMEFASEYMDTMKGISSKFGFAVLRCVISPVLLILLIGMSEDPAFHVSEGLAVGLGVSAILVLVASAVMVFIIEGMKLSKYEFLENEPISLMYGVEAVVKRKKEAFEPGFRIKIAIAVIICIVSVIPVIIAGAADAKDIIVIVCVCVLLILVSIATYTFVSAGMIYGSYTKLLQEEEYTIESKNNNKRFGGIYGAYWCVIVAIFLAYSYRTGGWDMSWIIFAVAGILFVPFKFLVEAIGREK